MTRGRDRESSYSPKHRIVGAIILVSLAVIFLPMILNPDQPPPRPTDASRLDEISKPETQVFRMPAASLDQVASPESSQDVTASPADTNRSDKRSTAAKPSTSVAKATTDKRGREHAREDTDMQTTVGTSADKSTQRDTQVSTSVGSAVAAKKADGWIVQVGTFSDSENAKRLQDRLQQSGFLVSLQSLDLKGRKVVRVRVGPYRQKHVAMEARSRIEKEVGVEGVVLAYP